MTSKEPCVPDRRLLIGVDELPDIRGLNSTPFALPTGTVTFLLTDVEGSTLAWQRHPDSMPAAISRHYAILDEAIARWGGVRPIEQGEGDSVVGAFARPSDALAAALDAQRLLHAESWPDGVDVKVRMAVHTGEAVQRDEGNYVGTTIIRTARIRSAGHGGQVLVSDAAAAVSGSLLPEGASLIDLGVHRLKDLARPERIWLLSHPDLPRVSEPLRSLDAYRHNLPSMPTPIIGRRADLRSVIEELDRDRLVTLTGAGGVGKTRLAAQIGAEVIDRFPGGVWWLEMAPIADPTALAPALLAAMGVSEDGMRPPVTVAVDRLTVNGPAMVILDNCEHLLNAAADLADALRNAVPELVILATSREPLGLPGEVTWRVPSLAVPPPAVSGAPIDIDTLSQFDSVRLFLDRARRARPQFVLGDMQAAAIAEICHRLDGIPLAIELAASRCRQFPPERIAKELADRFRLLTGGSRTLLPRQQTLLASVEWSHDLLDDDERKVLRRLSVFSGPFRWEAAEAVVASPGDVDRWTVLDVLGRLVDKSLVQLSEPEVLAGVSDDGEYRMLETVRQFAIDRARQTGELSLLRDAHADWWIAMLDGIDARQPSDESLAICNHHAQDLRSALDWLDEDLERRHRLLSLVALSWTWAGRSDDVLAYATRWLLSGPDDGDEVGWALAMAPCGPALFTTLNPLVFDQGKRAFAIAERVSDARAMFPLSFLVAGQNGHVEAVRAIVSCFDSARGQDAYRMISTYGPFLLGWVDGIDPNTADRLGEALSEALSLDLGPHRINQQRWFNSGHTWRWRNYYEWSNPEPVLAETFLFDRLLAESGRIPAPLFSGDLSRLTPTLAYLSNYMQIPVGRLWWAMAMAVQHLVEGSPVGAEEAQALAMGFSAAPIYANLPCCRALISIGEFELAHSLADKYDTPGSGTVAHPLASALFALHDGEVVNADRFLHQALEAVTAYPWSEAAVDIFELLAVVAGLVDDHARAARLFGANGAIRARIGYVHRLADQRQWVTEMIAAGEAALGVDEWKAEVERGHTMSEADAFAYARRPRSERKRPAHGWDSLTPTELQVCALIAGGLTNPEIAERLFMGKATVKTHVTHALTKMGMATRSELAAEFARRTN